jgi:hypothetical protein
MVLRLVYPMPILGLFAFLIKDGSYFFQDCEYLMSRLLTDGISGRKVWPCATSFFFCTAPIV